MKRFIGLLALCAMTAAWPAALVFAQDGSEQYRAEVTGTWKHEREGLTFQFNADGSFTMSEDGAEARKAMEAESRRRGEAAATSVGGTYTVARGVINMVMVVDGKSHRLRMAYKKIDADTLQMERQNYRRVNQ
ncbi:MAG: hypothetical protein LBK63_05015 [Treponema sp.]|nr:hypothetical protein [Treponema sp.]